MLRVLRKQYESGVQIVAGTDASSGYAFDRELEVYVDAGIPSIETLRLATIQASTLMHKDQDLGPITARQVRRHDLHRWRSDQTNEQYPATSTKSSKAAKSTAPENVRSLRHPSSLTHATIANQPLCTSRDKLRGAPTLENTLTRWRWRPWRGTLDSA